MQTLMQSLRGLPPKQALALALAERVRRRQLRQQHEEEARQRMLLQQQGQPPQLGEHSSLVMSEASPFHDLLRPSRYKIYYGGRDSAKSWSFAEALVRIAKDRPIRILCTREFQISIKDSVHKLLKDTIRRLGLDEWFNVTQASITSRAGAEFIFKGIKHFVGEVKSTEGIDICWVEEAHNTSEDSWYTLIPTIRKEGSEIWISLNVTDELAPTHKRFITNTPPDSIIHMVNYDQNPYLTNTSRREIEYLKRVDFAAFEHIYGGKPKKISDAIIFGGRYEVQAFPDNLWEKADRLLFGADWGFAQDPSVLTRAFMLPCVPRDEDPDYLKGMFHDLYIEYEAWGIGVEFAGEIVDGKGELERLFRSVPGADKWPIKADCSRPETISFMSGCGLNIDAAEKWDGCVEDGITHIKGFRKIYIHPRCTHTIDEAGLYSYKKDKITNEVLPVILDKHNHCWDAVRYSLDGYIQRTGSMGVWARLGKDSFING